MFIIEDEKYKKFINNIQKIYVRQNEIYKSDENNVSYENNKYFYDNLNLYNHYIRKDICYGAVSQFFGIYKCANLCKDSIDKYDYVIRLRMDDTITNNFELPELNENEIVVNKILNYSDSIKVHDHFFIARPHTYLYISELYNNLNNIIDYIFKINGWIPEKGYHETFLFIHLVMKNIKIKTTGKKYYIHKYNTFLFLDE
jgi:hypothetical protein